MAKNKTQLTWAEQLEKRSFFKRDLGEFNADHFVAADELENQRKFSAYLDNDRFTKLPPMRKCQNPSLFPELKNQLKPEIIDQWIQRSGDERQAKSLQEWLKLKGQITLFQMALQKAKRKQRRKKQMRRKAGMRV